MTGQNAESTGNKVVISGIAGRFPNSSNITELQNNLLNKVDCTTTEHKRWNIDDPRIPNRLGVCSDIEKFDRIFFGIHTALTDIMDPVSRMLLEHSFEAIMDAGINPRSLRGEKIAVYSATNLSESEKRAYDPKAKKSGFGIMGGSKAMIANRISFFLGLTGPSINMDCDTASAAVAIERAYLGIKNGEFNSAIVAGGIMALHPHVSFQLHAIGRLSEDGYTRSFDDEASGHTRSDGIAVLFLQRAQDAKRIYIEVLNVRAPHAAPYCYPTMTDIIPTRAPQVKLMKELLEESGLSPDDISFLEASGMGFRDIDAEELEAIAEVYNKRKKPLLVGAIQSNLGNTVPINSAAGIIKMIIASETGQIPPNLNYDTPNSKAKCLEDGTVEILTEMTPWTGQYSSVHTLSNTGIVSNILLKTPNIEKKNDGVPDDDLPRLVVVSGRTEEAVDTLLNYMENRPVDAELLQMFYDVFESGIDGHLYRGYSIVPAKGLLPPDAKKRETFFNSGETREVWWVFSGMGSQWVGMGEALLRIPVFDAAIRRCDAVLKPQGYDIYKIICDKDPKMFDNIVHSFIGIAAIQIALVDVLRSVGMKPDFIIGHSVGELGCAYADDCFTAEQMIMAALSRGLASKEVDLIHGAMAAVGLGYDDIKPLCPPDIDVACHNGPDSSTISGPAESLRAFVASLTAKKIFAKEVASSNIAYHSRYIAPAGPKLLEYLQKVIPKPNPRSEKWLSTSVPRREWNTLKARLCSAEYHTNNLLSAVLFEETSRMIPQNAICIEIAPHGLLQAILKKSLSPNCINVPLTKRGHPDNVEFMLTGLGKLFNIGLNPKVSNLYPKVKYPVGRGTPSISSLVKWDHNADWYVTYFVPSEKKIEGEVTLEMDLNAAENEYLKGCRINGEISIPISLCLVKAWDLFKTYDKNQADDIVFEDVQIHRLRVPVPQDNIVKLTIMVTKGNGKFEIVESDTLVTSGTLKSIEAANVERLDASKSYSGQNVKCDIENEDFYKELEMRGFQYFGNFRSVLKSSMSGNNGLIKWDGNWVTFIESAIQLYTFENDVRQAQVPFVIRKIIIDHQKQEAAVQDSGVTAFIDKNLNCITVGGLEIQGLRLAVVPKILEQNRLSSDTLAVVPNIDKTNTSISDSLRMILQLVLENSFSNNLQAIQLIENDGSEASKAYKSVLYHVPEICLFKRESTTCEEATFNKALTILIEDLTEYDVSLIFQKLRPNKFLLTNIKNENEDSFIKLAESSNLKVVLVRKFINNNNLVLFRKKQLFANTQVINVNGNVKDTINKVKAIGVPSDDERIVIVTKPKDKLNIVDLVNQLEQSTKLDKIRIFDIQDVNATDNLFADQVYKKQLEMDLLINVLTPRKEWATLRRIAATHNIQPCKVWTANQLNSYDPTNLTWTEGPCVEQPENVIKVEYSSFNYQDVLLANNTFYSEISEISGMNRILPATFGFEYSGTDAKGNRVMGITCGNAMSTFVKSNPIWTWAMPQSWSFEDGATVPLSYIIAYAALFGKAEIEAGEKVLLHSISDGTGLAMLNIAVHKKCEVYVTYQTEQERKLIKLASNLPDHRLFDSSKESFTDDVLLKTGGKGVDVVICNQCGAKKAELLFGACKRKARVVLLSDMNDNRFHESIGMEIFLREISFFSVVPKQILVSDSNNKRTLANMLLDGIKTGCVKPLARNVYDNKAINEAFHACLSNSNLGKIIVKVSAGKKENNQIAALQRLYCSSSKTYVMIEGLSAFGLELIDWLITRGAKRIVLVSQSEVNDGYTNLRLSLWQKYGVQVILRTKVDISQAQNIKALLKEASSLGPIDAIFDLQRMISTTGKSNTIDLTTKTADQESRLLSPNLRLFAVFSAVVNAGALPSKLKFIKSYSIDDIQERPVRELLEKRKKDGLHSVLIRWGLKDDNSVSKPIIPPINKYLQKLDDVLTIKETAVEISYAVPLVDKVGRDSVEMQLNQLDAEKLEKDAFMASLNKPIIEDIFVLDI